MKPTSLILILLRSILAFAAMLAIAALLAGTFNYWQGWVFSFFMGVTAFIQYLIFARNESLAEERKKPGPGIKSWDIVFFLIFAAMIMSAVAIGILDSGRFFWTGEVGSCVYAGGFVALSLGITGFFWPMWINNWFSMLVRIQKDRKQKVVDIGPYKIVRHPGYVGAILICIGIPLTLGSLRALIPGCIAVLALIVRTALEDEMLKNELPGYKEFAKKTKYRLIPGIW